MGKLMALLILPAALALGNSQLWPMGEQFNREIVLNIPRPARFPSPFCQIFLDHAPWDEFKSKPHLKKGHSIYEPEGEMTDEQ